MKPQEPFATQTTRRAVLFAACGWTVVLLLFAVFEDFGARREAMNLAYVDAVICFEKDIAYRQWASLHGGVYVPVTKETPPNPFLADWPERDITTPSGKKLTLMNPAYMTRQIHELFKTLYGVTGHITSLKPINPVNAADAWETAALKMFEKGAKQISSAETVNGKPVLRFMRPFITEKSCLKCHEAQGYKEDNIRGGISVGVPLKPYFAATINNRNDAWLCGGGIWALGMLGLMANHRRMKQTIQQSEESAQRLHETEDRLRLLYDSMLEGMALHEIVCDANGQPCDYRFLQVNPAFERLTGLKAADIIGKTACEVLPGIDRKWIERYGRVVLTGESCQFEDYSAEIGRHFHIAAFCPRKGQFAVTFSDITERKRAEEALQESDEKFSKAFQTSPYAITITRPEDGRFIEVNDAFTSMTGFTREEAFAGSSVGLKLWVHEEDRLRVVADLRAGRPVVGQEFLFRKKSGEVIPCLFSALTIRLREGLCILSSVLDITERKKTEEDLNESRAAALNMMEDAVAARDRSEQASEALRREVEERRRAEDEVRRLNTGLEQRVAERTAELQMANKEMEAFSYSVSHDLRAPLRAMSGFATILAEDCAPRLDEEGRRLLGTICSEAGRMGQMIDELLAFSRLGRQSMQVAEVDMTALAQSVFDQSAAQASGRNIQFKLNPLPAAQGDAAMLSHVWANLISNAIKYTRGKPVAEIEISGRADDKGGIVYCVKDNGAGFDMKYVQKLFGVFQRLHAETDFEGTGVGLALVQRIVQRHSGRVWAESEVNKGAAFYFTLPAEKT